METLTSALVERVQAFTHRVREVAATRASEQPAPPPPVPGPLPPPEPIPVPEPDEDEVPKAD
jgi:hypothetical protein